MIGAGGVATVAAFKIAQNADVFTEFMIASRRKEKCDAIVKAIKKKAEANSCVPSVASDQRSSASLFTFIARHITLALLHSAFITLWYLLRAPAGNIFRRGVEGQHVVQVLMVKAALDETLHLREVYHHAVLVQLTGLTIKRDDPVMAMHLCAFTFIIDSQLMAG